MILDRFPWLFFPAQKDVFEKYPDPDKEDSDEEVIDSQVHIDGSFEVVPGVTAEQYIQRFIKVTVPNPNQDAEQRNIQIRVPPHPEVFYDTKIRNNELVMPSEMYFQRCSGIIGRWRRKEIDRKTMDLMICQLIVKMFELKRLKKGRFSDTNSPQRSSSTVSNPQDPMIASTSSMMSI